MSSQSNQYDDDYFASYLGRSRILGRMSGDKWIYRYWARFLKSKLAEGAPVCEIGCGLGFFGSRIHDYFQYTGCDVSDYALREAKRLHAIEKTVLVDAQSDLPFGDASFDAVVAFDVVEHLPEPSFMFREVHRVLRPKGLFIMSTPNTNSLGVRLKSRGTSLIPSMLRDETHVTLMEPDEWLGSIRYCGLKVVRVGTDSLWDVPYTRAVPKVIQKVALVPFNIIAGTLVGILPWSLGENLLVVSRKF